MQRRLANLDQPHTAIVVYSLLCLVDIRDAVHDVRCVHHWTGLHRRIGGWDLEGQAVLRRGGRFRR